MYLLDTNVISELRKASTNRADPNVVNWASSISPVELFISVITILEIEMGILSVHRRDFKQGNILRNWMDNHVMSAFANRIIAFDLFAAKRCAQLHIPTPKSDRDAMIAASAITHGMTLATRNIIDFKDISVTLINPWDKQI